MNKHSAMNEKTMLK